MSSYTPQRNGTNTKAKSAKGIRTARQVSVRNTRPKSTVARDHVVIRSGRNKIDSVNALAEDVINLCVSSSKVKKTRTANTGIQPFLTKPIPNSKIRKENTDGESRSENNTGAFSTSVNCEVKTELAGTWLDDNIKEDNIDKNPIETIIEMDDPSTFRCDVSTDVTTPWLRGITCVADGDIVCLDLNNACLKRFHKNYEYVSSIDVSPDNNGLTSVSKCEIAVTCLNEVHFYNVGKFGMNRLSKYFRMSGIGYGISHDKDWFAVTCDVDEEEEATLRILNDVGDEVSVIESREIDGRRLRISWYVQINRSKEEVYVSDADSPRILCFSFKGEALWTLPVKGEPRDLVLAVDCLLISDQYEQTVLKADLDGRKCSSLYTFDDGIINPDYVAYCPFNGRLYVTYRGFGSVGVFTL